MILYCIYIHYIFIIIFFNFFDKHKLKLLLNRPLKSLDFGNILNKYFPSISGKYFTFTAAILDWLFTDHIRIYKECIFISPHMLFPQYFYQCTAFCTAQIQIFNCAACAVAACQSDIKSNWINAVHYSPSDFAKWLHFISIKFIGPLRPVAVAVPV